MSEVFRCEDKETLVAYLYGEVDGDVRREVERHLRTCTACSRESEGLQAVRQDLQLWMPPDAEFGFSIVPNGGAPTAKGVVLNSSRWTALRELPVWAQVAAAALFMATAVSIANVQVRSTNDGLVVTTGWMQRAEPAVVATDVTPSADAWRAELVALEQNLRDELRADIRTQVAAQQAAIRNAVATAPVPASGDSTAAVMRRVQSMIDASEDRQRQEMAIRFAQAERTWSTRWTTDRATLNRQLGNLQGRTMAVQAGQQELRNQIRLQRVSSPQPNQ